MERRCSSLRYGSALLVLVSAFAACVALVTSTAGIASAQSVNGYSIETVGSTKTVGNVTNNLSDIAIDNKGRWVAAVNAYAIGDLKSSGSGYEMTALVGDLMTEDPKFDVEGIDYLEGNLYAVTLEGKMTSELRIYELTKTKATLKKSYALEMPVAVNNKGAEGVVLQKIAKVSSGTQYTLLTATEGHGGVKPQLYSFTVQADKNSNFSSKVTKNWGPVPLNDSAESTALEIDPETGHLLVLTEKGDNYINLYELGNGTVKFLERLAPNGPFTRMNQPEGLAFNPSNADQLIVVGEKNEVLELRVNRSAGPGIWGDPSLTQDCYYYGDEASPALAGTAIQRRILMNGSSLFGRWTKNTSSTTEMLTESFASYNVIGPETTAPNPLIHIGKNPGEQVDFRYYHPRNKSGVLDSTPAISCSVPLQQKGTRRVPAAREETLGVRIGQDCVDDDIDRLYPIITNTTSSPKTYVVEWNWENYGSGLSPFQWSTADKPSGFTYTAQNFFESGSAKTKQRIILKPGESTPPASIVHEGRHSGQIVGIRILRDSPVSNWSLGFHNLSSPASGQEIFKATVKTSACGNRSEVVEVVQECQYRLQRDSVTTAPSSRENRLRVNVTNPQLSGGGVYTVKFYDDANNQLLATEQLNIWAGNTGTMTLDKRKDGERIRVEIDSPFSGQPDQSFTAKVDACTAAYDH